MASRERPWREKNHENGDSIVVLDGVTSFGCLHEPLTASLKKGDSAVIRSTEHKDALNLMKILAGIMPAATGRADVLGARCNSSEGRSVISSFGSFIRPYLGATLWQNLLLYQGFQGSPIDREVRAKDVIGQLQLAELGDRHLAELDKEELSLVSFACFLVQRAQLSCMFDSIDLSDDGKRRKVASSLAALRSQGRTFLWLSPPIFFRDFAEKEIVLSPKMS